MLRKGFSNLAFAYVPPSLYRSARALRVIIVATLALAATALYLAETATILVVPLLTAAFMLAVFGWEYVLNRPLARVSEPVARRALAYDLALLLTLSTFVAGIVVFGFGSYGFTNRLPYSFWYIGLGTALMLAAIPLSFVCHRFRPE